MRDVKYLFAYTIPLSAFASFASTGIWTYSAVFYAFLVLPILDVVTGEKTENLKEDDVAYKKTKWIFDAMLYLNVPIVFGLLAYGLHKVQTVEFATYEWVGLALSGGILLASCKMVWDLSKNVPMVFRSPGKVLIKLFHFMFNSKCHF